MSSLLLVPALLRQLSPAAKLAVVTSDSKQFREDLLGISHPDERARIVIGGIEDGVFYQNVMKSPPVPTDAAEIEKDVAACVARLRAANPEIAALLITCTGLPMVIPAIRRITGLPVYDITTLCRSTLSSLA
ncbi:hypothetical protein LMTR13_25635 [Bradyrhizobium icense]|uniref:Asp/Glu racemase n=2 Tax=Bradyrhizobium icense TaxID=1274631 RepID=A0A1B1UST6_9BRAD|nr:hypothetical protein LMTR13_25635 [Bradyrhizobium icense]